ncbi:MAG TPA: 4'-phosphopantetheinyl transferase superfamily protein [Actinomycetota bacterium]|jgi:holo-[acyl-carrier protein] synthase|nr:4'-phosphopantetheinyl transferase superfamily protein [Actinomycetota bacterium]
MLGVDVVDVERLRLVLARSPGLEERLFTAMELRYCSARRDRVVHLAGTLAAKEAVIKALDLGPLAAWARRIEIRRARSGAPSAVVNGRPVTISISHDAGVAVAAAISLPAA